MRKYKTSDIAQMIGKSRDYVSRMIQWGTWGIDKSQYEKYGSSYILTYEQAMEIVRHYGSECVSNLQKTKEVV